MHIYKAIQRHPNTYILLHTHTLSHTLTNLYIHFDTHTVTHTHILSPSLSPLTCALTYSLSKCTENYTHVQHTHAQRDLSKPINKFNKTMYTFFLSKCINSKKHCSRSSRLYKMHTHTVIQRSYLTLPLNPTPTDHPNANQPLYSPPTCCDKSSTLPLGFCSGDGALFSAPLSVFPPLLPLSLPDGCCCSGGGSGFPCCEAGLCCGAPCCCSPACSGAVFVCGSGLLPSC